jgi:hypothetical protein
MNDEAMHDWIRSRSKLASQNSGAPIDVGPALDKTPLVLGGGLLALAASIIILLAPSLAMMTEPWISFWLI